VRRGGVMRWTNEKVRKEMLEKGRKEIKTHKLD
jgi:hypothetical protein